jgi:hypothetical protein
MPTGYSTPVDVDGDGVVGPQEALDLSAFWKSPALSVGGDSLWQASGVNIYRASGNVGIGSATPHHRLKVSGGTHWTQSFWLGSMELDNGGALAWNANGAGNRFGIGVTDGGMWFFRTPSDPGNTDHGAVYDLVIDDNGRVGIGGPFPTFPLTLRTFNGYGLVHTNGTVQVGTTVDGGGASIGTLSNHSLRLFTNNAQASVVLTTAGNLGVGSLVPSHRLRIAGGPSWTTAGWGGALELDNAAAIAWRGNAAGSRFGIGQSSGGLYFFRTASDPGNTANAALYDMNISDTGTVNVGGTGAGGTRFASFGGPGLLAALFNGGVHVQGTITKNGGSFKIDHPVDPENKTLSHSFVESPDMMNVYNGNIVTDATGYATVILPEWFESLNKDFRYQLTVVDEEDSADFIQAKVVKKISGNRFTLRTSAPETEVSWLVTGVRRDAWANANRIPVEEEKSEEGKGRYLNPELFGAPADKGIYSLSMREPSSKE